jgi:hypothetical protein
MTARVRAIRPSPLSRLARTHAITTASDATIAAALAGTFFFDAPTDEARTRVAIWLACTLVPFAVVAPCLGGAVRRLPPSGHAIAAIGVARAAVAALLAITIGSRVVYVVSLGTLVLGEAYATLRRAIVPVTVADPDDLVRANARLSRVGSLAGVAGGGLGIASAAVGGPPVALLLAALGHGLGAQVARSVPAALVPVPAPRRTARGGGPATRIVRTPPVPPVPLLSMASLRAAGAVMLFTVALSSHASDRVPVLLAAVAVATPVGSFCGTIVGPPSRRLLGSDAAVLTACTAAGISTTLLAVGHPSAPGFVATALVLAAASSAARQAYDATVQRAVADRFRRAAFARAELFLQVAWAVGALVPTVLRPGLREGCALVLAVLAVGAGAALVTAKPRRSARVSTSHPAIARTSNRCVDRARAAPTYSCP